MEMMSMIPELEAFEKEEPVIKHICKEPKEEDIVESYIKGNDLGSRLNRWITRKRILSPTHDYAQTCLKSTSAIKYEISNHLLNFRRMIHPFSPFRNFWNVTMVLFTLAALLMTPYLNTFFFDNSLDSLPFILIIDFVLLSDVPLLFFTGYYDRRTKAVTLDPRIVFTKYTKSTFIIDFLSALPVELFDYLSHGFHEAHVNWYCSTFNFIKIFRIRNLLNYVHHLRKSYQLSFHQMKILEVTLIILISMHWSACLVYYVPMLAYKFNTNTTSDSTQTITTAKSWILSASMQERDTRLKKYILCLNRATTSLVSSAHYLDVSSTEDMIMNFILAVFGKIGFIYLLAQFLQLMTTYHTSNKERLKLLQQLHEYMQYKELPPGTQKRLLVYCNYCYKRNFNRDKRILAQVSEPLREELILHNYMRLLQTVDLFNYLPKVAITKLVNFIKPQIYLGGDTIVKAGTPGDSLYFVGSGTVAVYTSLGKEVCHLEDGSYFGEIALVIENEHRVANVVAIETCEIIVVPREAFQQVISPYPNLLARLQKVALERLEKTLLLDEIYRLEDPHPHYINISNIRGKRRA